jgi:cell division protein FtsI (penicillin-binding protein 3)
VNSIAASAVLPRGVSRTPARAPVALAGRRQAAFARARYRLVIGGMVFSALTVALTVRLADLALLYDAPAEAGAANATPRRGDIVDRNGVELARSFEAFGVSVFPRQLVSDPRTLARRLSGIITDRTEAQLYAELTHRATYRYLSRRVLPAQAKAINDLGEPAITLEREPERLYPNLNLGAHVLGYTESGKDRAFGRSGLEAAFDKPLADPVTRAKPIVLAMDSRVQQAMTAELAAAVAKHRAIGAAGIVLDVDSGEVVALVSLPDFNPNAPGHSPADNRFNRATQGVYELGSTFKALTIAMGLDSGVITSMHQTFDARAPIRVGGFTIHDDRSHQLRKFAATPEIFVFSSNIGTARMASALGAERQRAYLDRLGFLSPVKVELNERSRTLYPKVNNWGESATMTVGYGHGISVSPLHLATSYAALVNGGILRPATMLKVPAGQKVPGTRVFSEATSDKMRALLRFVVTSGTGRKANTPGYRVGGKTGTSIKVVNGRYAHKTLVSTFAAAFPMDAPRYVVIAMLDEPKGTADTGGYATAGMVAAPIVGNVVARIAPVLGVAPDVARDVDIRGMLGLVDAAGAEHE